jgi:hypothetical protein
VFLILDMICGCTWIYRERARERGPTPDCHRGYLGYYSPDILPDTIRDIRRGIDMPCGLWLYVFTVSYFTSLYLPAYPVLVSQLDCGPLATCLHRYLTINMALRLFISAAGCVCWLLFLVCVHMCVYIHVDEGDIYGTC